MLKSVLILGASGLLFLSFFSEAFGCLPVVRPDASLPAGTMSQFDQIYTGIILPILILVSLGGCLLYTRSARHYLLHAINAVLLAATTAWFTVGLDFAEHYGLLRIGYFVLPDCSSGGAVYTGNHPYVALYSSTHSFLVLLFILTLVVCVCSLTFGVRWKT